MPNYPLMLPGSIDSGKPAERKSRPVLTKKTSLPKGLYTPPGSKKKAKTAEIKILRPTPGDLEKISKTQNVPQVTGSEHVSTKRKLSVPGVPTKAISQVTKFGTSLSSDTRTQLTNLLTTRSGLYALSKWLTATILTLIIGSVIFVSYFDRYHLIKDWSVEFTTNSYLDKQTLQQVVQELKSNRVNYIFPANNYWFLNDGILTDSVRHRFPQIQKIKVKDVVYPDKAVIEITTSPVLATLSVNTPQGIQLWRVDMSGRLVSQDTANRLEKVVYVDRSVSLDRPDTNLSETKFIEDNLEQLDRLYFINFTWQVFEQKGIGISYTSIPSLNSADKDVTIHLSSGSRILLNSSILDKNSHGARLEAVLSSDLLTGLEAGRISYLDMRQTGRLFSCC